MGLGRLLGLECGMPRVDEGEHLKNPSSMRLARALLVTCIAAPVLLACVSPGPRAAQPVFDGDWHVRWCDEQHPDLECGGFWLTLVQRGNELCGTFDGARVNFAQVDEGQGIAVRGKAKGNVADLTIQSGRNGGVHRARATVTGDRMHWTLGETVTEPEYQDIDIIAIDQLLARAGGSRSKRHKDMSTACAAK